MLAHLRSVAGSDVLLAAYNAARTGAAAQRQERRRQKAVQARTHTHGLFAQPVLRERGLTTTAGRQTAHAAPCAC